MSTQVISDYLTKQIFIERTIVTFRSLSRQFSIHVNAAKNELATYHHNAPYQSQKCSATFLISGTPSSSRAPMSSQISAGFGGDDDVDMDGTQREEDDDDDEEYGEGEDVPHIKIMLVNEKDLEDAQSSFDEVHSIHVYSLSPAPLKDAGLICAPTEDVRNTDKTKGLQFSASLGRVVGKGIKPGKYKKRTLPPAAPAGPVAGPSKVKVSDAAESKAADKTESKDKDKAAEKPKPTGKIDFFKKAEKPKEVKETGKAKEVKKEPTDTKKKMFFSNPKPPAKVASKAPSPAPSEASTKGQEKEKEQEPPAPARGMKRKSSVGLETKEKEASSKNANTSSSKAAAEANVRIKRKVVLSDDEEESISTRPVRKTKKNIKVESAENSEAEREAKALMDIDDADVERVSRVPSAAASTVASTTDREAFEDEMTTAPEDEDISMSLSDDASIKKPKTTTRKRKPKVEVPVGRNGIKKRKVMKTRRTVDANGYTHKEDYSDWESVDSADEPEPPAPNYKTKAKGKAKSTAVKKEEDEDEEMPPAPPAKEKAKPKAKAVESEKTQQEKPEAALKKAPAAKPAAKPKPAPAKGGPKTQKGLMNFFGPKKT